MEDLPIRSLNEKFPQCLNQSFKKPLFIHNDEEQLPFSESDLRSCEVT